MKNLRMTSVTIPARKASGLLNLANTAACSILRMYGWAPLRADTFTALMKAGGSMILAQLLFR